MMANGVTEGGPHNQQHAVVSGQPQEAQMEIQPDSHKQHQKLVKSVRGILSGTAEVSNAHVENNGVLCLCRVCSISFLPFCRLLTKGIYKSYMNSKMGQNRPLFDYYVRLLSRLTL